MQEGEITDEYDREFLALIIDIEKRTQKLSKHDKLRVESWCKKLCQVTNNIEWKKNRNLHAICLMDMILNNRFEEPYNKFAPDGSIPILSKTLVKSRLSPKFWKSTEKLYEEVSKQRNIFDNQSNGTENNIQSSQNNNSDSKKPIQQISNLNSNIVPEIHPEEIEKMKTYIAQLQNDLAKKDKLIQNQKEEKIRLTKRVDELEKMLSTFLALEKP